MKRKKKYSKKGIFCLGAIVLLISFPANAQENRQRSIKCRGNIVLDQEDNIVRVAFYEDDVKYLEREIERLRSQLEN